ncbi:MAG: hypothetical protein SFX18_11090 [Pirellulales bacterium]|nr:hypothetical protein [Pirellulales bacterium]
MRLVCSQFSWLVLVVFLSRPALGDAHQPLPYRPAPVDNPLKGLVPYQADVRDKFPHTLEFNYLPYAALVRGYDKFDWQPLEQMLDDIAGRGHQAVLRIYLEYPDKTDGIPQFLIRDGLKVHKYQITNTQPFPPAWVETPDYEDQNLRRSLKNFLAAFGKKYDGDPRIGFITAGLLGTWGEWHTYPREELFASKQVQEEVMDAYEAAFRVTPVLLRYPAGEGDHQKATNSDRKFGYHDDSFAWATLETGKKGDEWFFMTTLKAAGPAAQAKWRTHPIGGEIRPEAWGQVFDKNPGKPEIQDFRKCVKETHATWLLDSGMFRGEPPADRISRAEAEVRRMGYEFYAPAVTIGAVQGGKFAVTLEIENRGVAPFYYDWPPEYGLMANGKVVQTFIGSGKLTGLLPGDRPRVWSDTLDATGMSSGEYALAVRVPNPLKTGQPMRFANTTQDADAPGWLSLGVVQIR